MSFLKSHFHITLLGGFQVNSCNKKIKNTGIKIRVSRVNSYERVPLRLECP